MDARSHKAKRRQRAIVRKSPQALDPARVHQLRNWILDGASEHDISEAVKATWPDADAKPLIVAAIASLTKAGEVDPSLVRGWCIEATRKVYAAAVAVADHQTSLRAIRQIEEFAARDETAGASDSDAAGRLQLVANHLLPLQLVDGAYPLEEHARVAADVIRTHGLANLRRR